MEQQVFDIPHIVERIAWHINDPKTWLSFAKINHLSACAAQYWIETKKTQFRTPFKNCFILPNGEYHGPVVTNNYDLYYHDGYNHNTYKYYDFMESFKIYAFACGENAICVFPGGVGITTQKGSIIIKKCTLCSALNISVNGVNKLRNPGQCNGCCAGFVLR